MVLKEFIKQVKALFSTVKLTQEPLIDTTLIQYDGDELAVGSTVYLVSGAGEYSILPDGGYETKRGLRFVVKDGTVTSIDKTSYIEPQPLPDPLPQGQSNVASSNYSKTEKDNSMAEEVILAKDTKDKKVTADSAAPGGEPDGDETPGPSGVTDVDSTDGSMDWATEVKKVSKQMKDIAAAMEDFKSQLGKFTAIETDLSEIKQKVDTFAKAPAAAPIEVTLNPFKKTEGSRAMQILGAK